MTFHSRLYEKNGISQSEVLDFTELAAVATVGDVMDLQGENRIIVKEGLRQLSATHTPGLRALIRANNLDGAEITAYHVGFVLGPCINASGRLDTAARSLELLCETNEEKAAELAGDLLALNQSRKAMTEKGKEEAIRIIQKQIDRFRKGGDLSSMFPDRWLPTTFAVLPEPFTEQNGMVMRLMESAPKSGSSAENVAFATVGDVMDLTGENRILVKEGLKRLNHTRNEGFRALIAANGLTEGPISAYHIGFVLGPCINATGRLDTAKRALKLLMVSTPEQAKILAEELKSLNDERKDMTQQGVAEAMELMESTSMKEDKVLVIYLPTCHESLAGIIAGRIREKYNRPVFVLTKAEEGVKGSGRSIEAYNMFQELCKVSGLFTKFGGHPMAAGLSLPEENVERFRKEINEAAELTEDDLLPKIMIDVPMPLDYIKEKLIRELSVLEPFGKANTKPVFADRNLKILQGTDHRKNRNVLKNAGAECVGCTMEALYFGGKYSGF